MTKAIILAAGQGTRLRPLTNSKPKCLVPLVGKSLLERQVQVINECGLSEIHVATGYCSDQISKLGFETSFNPNYKKTNMVESLFTAMEFLRNCKEDLLIAYGDIVYNKENLEILLGNDSEISIMVDENWRELWSLRIDNPLDDAETLLISKDGFITELGKKPKSYDEIQGQYTGLIKVRADKINDLILFYENLSRDRSYDGNDFYNMYMTSFIQLLIDAGWKVNAVMVHSGWLEIDSVDDLAIYESLEEEGNLAKFYRLY